jgi:SAM-dependent methyltransferase
MLGAERLETMDASAFEGASITHDLNQPVPPELKGKFDAVIDAGTLEHVFDVPTALRGCLEMVKPGGHFVSFAPANNYFGHGFYQFSPELFFRVLSPANGFRLEWMVAVEYGPRRRWFEVSDPEAIKSRVVLINHFPVLLFLYAKKVASVELLTASPLQSDYVAMWADTTLHPDKVTASAKGLSARLVPRLKRWLTENTPGLARFLEAFLFSSLNRDFSFRNCRSFKRLDKKRP